MSPLLLHIVEEFLRIPAKEGKQIEGVSIGKKEGKWSLFGDDMMACPENVSSQLVEIIQ